MTIAKETEVIIPSVDTEEQFWELHQPPTDLIFDDGEPMESNRHRINMNALIRSLLTAFAGRNDYFVGGNMFIYYNSQQARNRDFRGPDFFVALNVDGKKDRQGWVVWEEEGRYPNVIIELMSPSTAEIDKGEKKRIYEQIFRTSDYFVFDPVKPDSLQGWHLDTDNGYQPLKPNSLGRLWCQSLGLWVGTWEGVIEDKTAPWLRFFDAQGTLVLLPEEAEHQRAETERQVAQAERERAETERQRAERLAARLRELGEEIDF